MALFTCGLKVRAWACDCAPADQGFFGAGRVLAMRALCAISKFMSHTIMKKFIITLGAIAALTASIGAQAATGKITAVGASRDNAGFVYFKFTPSVGGGTLPACATGTATNVWVFVGENGAGGIENPHTLQLILAAYNGAKTVDLSAFNACDTAGRATLNTLILK